MVSKRITGERIAEFGETLYAQEKSQATIEKYLRDVGSFEAFVRGEEVTKGTVIRYKSHLLESYAVSSVNSMLVAVNSFLKFAGWYDCVVKTVRFQRQNFRSQDRELSRGEYLRLLEAAGRRKNQRLYYVLQTLASTGIRISELRFITVEAVQKGCAMVSLKGKTRQILLPASLCRELKEYAKKRGIRSGSLFVTKSGRCLDRSNVLHEMKSLCQEAGVDRKKVFPHNLRHLFACLYYKASKDITHLADLLGHSSINTTRIYTCTSTAAQQRRIDNLGLVIKIPHNPDYAVRHSGKRELIP